MTYTLTGFNIVKREGVELAGALIVTIDIQMRVGAIEESVVVTGESPVVDVQSARRQQIIGGPVLAALPTSRSYNSVLQLVPSVVAGDGNLQLRPTMLLFTAHGGSTQDGRLTVDGINTGSSRGGSGVSSYVPDIQNTSEVAFSISGNLGEAETGGPQMTVVPKSGGNDFSGTFVVNGVNEAMQDSNYTDRLKAAGLTAPPKVIKLYDLQGSAGGPVKRDRLWFYFNYRRYGSADAQPGIFANKNAGDPTKWTYDPDFSLQGRTDVGRSIYALRLTWQVSPRNKIMGFFDYQPECTSAAWVEDSDACRNTPPGDGWIQGGSQINNFFGPGPNAPETGDYSLNPNRVEQLKWQSPVTNRLLVEAAGGITWARWGYETRPGANTDDLIRVQEQAAIPGVGLAGLKYRSSNRPHGRSNAHTWNAAASYVTGAHNMKFGYQGAFMYDIDTLFNIINNKYPVSYRFNNTVPNQITQQAGEFERVVNTEYAAFYAQEQWTRGRLTLQGALRFDHAWSHFPEQTIGPDLFIPTPIVVPAEQGVRGFNNLSPRFGAAYDLRGNGKTSVKTYLGKYLSPATNQNRFVLTNPVERITTIVNRQWTDANTDYIPQCDLMNPGVNGECGAWLDQTFGRPRPSTNFDPGILGGWGVRPGDWQFGVSVQHEVVPRVSLEVAYDRRWWQNFADVTDNLAVASADYDPFSIVAPVDARLPDGGGYTISGLYDLDPTKLGQTDNFVRQADDYGGHTRYNDSVDFTVNARLRQRAQPAGRHQHGTAPERPVRDPRRRARVRLRGQRRAGGALLQAVHGVPHDVQGAGRLHGAEDRRAAERHVLEPSGREPVGQPGGAERADCAVARTAAVGRRERHHQPAGAEHDVRQSDQPGGHARGQGGALRHVARDVFAGRPQPVQHGRHTRVQPDVQRDVADADDGDHRPAGAGHRPVRLVDRVTGGGES